MSQEIFISTDKTKLDVSMIHRYLSGESYWAAGRSLDEVERSIEGSMCFGVYTNEQQIGFARVITDHVTIAHISDLFILDAFRNRGIAAQLMKAILSEENLVNVKRWMLGTNDAHGLYRKFGFRAPAHPDRWMERLANDDLT